MGLTFDLVFHYYFGDQLYLTVLLVGLLKEAFDFVLAEMAFLKFFSSPEPKAQVSFSDQNLSIVRRCCCCHKLLTLSSSSPEPLGQFNQTWEKSSLGEGDSSLFK